MRVQHWFLAIAALIIGTAGIVAQGRPANWVIRDGKLWVNGKWVFLKTAKPLRNFADPKEVDQLIADLDILKQKHFNCFEINCYWYQFDHTGDGTIDESTKPLRRLVDAIYAKGMFPCISVETYGVGGGRVPEGFWKKHPDAIAVDSNGKQIRDDEYGVGSKVPSFFDPDYLKASRNYIRNIARAVDCRKILYFETTVEPQFMGNHTLDFSAWGRRAYLAWRRKNGGPAWPAKFPAEKSFLENPSFLKFKADSLAAWVNGDAAAYRDVAGKDAYMAIDYLETAGPDMVNRNGNSLEFLRKLSCAKIIQVNWYYIVSKHEPNYLAYRNVRQVMSETGRDWAIAEHMTLNGTDYPAEIVPDMLRTAIRYGTQFSFEFVSVGTQGDFSVYTKGWQPKAPMAVVDDHWGQWMKEVKAAAKKQGRASLRSGDRSQN